MILLRRCCFGFLLGFVVACSATSLSTSYANFTVGGTVSGLNGNLTLTNNGVDTLVVTGNGPFTFDARVAATTTYQVAIQSQPVGQTCTIQTGTAFGSVVASNITSVLVTCTNGGAGGFNVSGTVTGLLFGTSITLGLGSQTAEVEAGNPNFIFEQPIADGSNYDIRVVSQPNGATCVVQGGIGTVASANIDNVMVHCTDSQFSLAASVSGLVSGDTVSLQLLGAAPVAVTGSGSGVDAGLLNASAAYGQAYSLAVAAQPDHATCIVLVPTGVVNGNTQVAVTCVRQSLPLMVQVTGLLNGDVVQVRDNGGAPLSVTGGGSGTDVAVLDAMAAYNGTFNVNVDTSPAGYGCTVPAASGTVVGLSPVVVNVTCTPLQYVLQAQVTGLTGGGHLGLSVNQNAPTTIVGGGTSTDNANLTTPVGYGSSYAVTVTGTPNNQACSITSGASGIAGFGPAVVHVTCVAGYNVSVTVQGLVAYADPVVLLNTYGASSDTASMSVNNANNNAAMMFAVRLPANTAYAVTVTSAVGYHCVFSGTAASGTVGMADVTGIVLTCNVSLSFTTQQNAAFVLGQSGLTQTSANRGGGSPAANTLSNPVGNPYLAPDGTLYIPDRGNARVLGYHQPPSTNGAPADFVMGQVGSTTAVTAISPNAFSAPLGIFGAKNALFIADMARVLVYNTLPHANVSADAVIGQPDFMTNTPNPNNNHGAGQGTPCDANHYQWLGPGGGVVTQGNLLVVPDDIDNRVLVYQDYTQSLEPNNALGQGMINSCYYGSGASTNNYNLASASSATIDGTRLWVTDQAQNRVMIWDDVTATNNGTPADHVMGQADFTHGTSGLSATAFNHPTVVLVANGQLFIADMDNNRVLIWNTAPSGAGAAYTTPPDVVLGQADANSGSCNAGGSAGANTLCSPQGLAVVGTSLYVADAANNRVLVYKSH